VRVRIWVGLAVGLVGLAIPTSASAATATFTNAGAIAMTDGGNSVPYPSSIDVSGLSGPVTDLAVTLNDFSHTGPNDVGGVLVAPGGQGLTLFDCVGGSDIPVSDVTFTLTDLASTNLPNDTGWGSGSFRATNYCDFTSNYPPPGPGTAHANPGPAAGGTATFGSTFGGIDPNGTWRLFVRDFNFPNGTGGDIGAGWSLAVTTPDPPDMSSPNTTITRGPKDKTKKKTATFEFTGTDLARGSSRQVAGFQCKLDAGGFVPCTSPHRVRVKKGKHTFQVRAIDQAGNVDGSPATDTWKRKKKKRK
jgi:hypothetical protein